MNQRYSAQNLASLATFLIALAGVIHLAIVPLHWAHAPAHGMFFILVGIAEIGWSIAMWRRPSVTLYYIGFVGTGCLVVLWGITRLLPAPFGHGPESVETYGLICKLSEALGVVVLAILAYQATTSTVGRPAAMRLIGLLVIAAIVAGFLLYGGARAAEPILPWLAVHEDEHKQEILPEHMDEHEQEITPTGYRLLSLPQQLV